MKIFQNGQFVEMPKEHKIYRLVEKIKNRQRTTDDNTQGGEKE